MTSARFLSIPIELRLIIYDHLFCVTTLSYGKDPNPHGLAIFTVCQLITTELQSTTWIEKTLFSFRGTQQFIDFFTRIPATAVSRIKHARVKAIPLPILSSIANDAHFITHGFTSVLSMVRGLALDHLELHSPFAPNASHTWTLRATYGEFKNLVSRSNGWKVLRYITQSTMFLVSEGPEDEMRHPQPMQWNRVLQARDDDEECASVVMYRSKHRAGLDGVSLALEDYDRIYETMEPFTQRDGPGEAQRAADEDITLDHETSGGRPVVLIAMRGRGADYVEDGAGLPVDIERHLDTYGWEGMKRHGLYWRRDSTHDLEALL